MSWFKQSLVVLAIALLAGVGWLRYFPGASESATRIGVPPAVVNLVAGQTEMNTEGQGKGQGGPGSFGGGQRPQPGALVVISAVGRSSINDRVTAIGDGEALRSVTVVPRSSGVVEEISVGTGQRVRTGHVMAVLDSEAERIARDQAALTVETAREKVGRYERLVESRAGTPVQLTDAKNELLRAELGLREAQLALDRRSVVAPFDGIVGFVPIERGDYVTQTTEVATIDDRSKILLDFWVPERFASLIALKQPVDAIAISLPDRVFKGEVDAIASRIDRDSRTMQIRAVLDNSADLLRPGMSFRVTLYFEGETYPAVDPLAIQWSSDGAYVWKMVEEKSMKVPVTIIQRNSDYVLVSGDIAENDEVVIEGLQNLRPGTDLKVARRTDAPVAPGS